MQSEKVITFLDLSRTYENWNKIDAEFLNYFPMNKINIYFDNDLFREYVMNKWDKVFKNRPSEICRRQP